MKSDRSANTVQTTNNGEPTKFVYLRDKGEKHIPDKLGEPRLDLEGNPIVVIRMPPEDLVQRVFLTKPNKRGNMKRARIIELINNFDDDLKVDPTRYQFKIAFEDDDSGLEDIISYNDILDYVEREHNNKDGHPYFDLRKERSEGQD